MISPSPQRHVLVSLTTLIITRTLLIRLWLSPRRVTRDRSGIRVGDNVVVGSVGLYLKSEDPDLPDPDQQRFLLRGLYRTSLEAQCSLCPMIRPLLILFTLSDPFPHLPGLHHPIVRISLLSTLLPPDLKSSPHPADNRHHSKKQNHGSGN
jgi:hypothetical protein